MGRQLGYWMETDKGYGRQAETDQQSPSELQPVFPLRAIVLTPTRPNPKEPLDKIFGARPVPTTPTAPPATATEKRSATD